MPPSEINGHQNGKLSSVYSIVDTGNVNDHGRDRGKRPVRIANCSGGQMEPGWQMRKQASWGDVDFITGDWLAENNIAQEAAAMEAGTGEGFKKNAWQALEMSMDVIAKKKIKVVIDGGGLSPENLAKKCQDLIDKNGYALKVAYVSGDNMVGMVRSSLKDKGTLPQSFQDINNNAHKDTKFGADDVLACTAYIGARGIVKALEAGADLVMCGRVADASPVIGACWWVSLPGMKLIRLFSEGNILFEHTRYPHSVILLVFELYANFALLCSGTVGKTQNTINLRVLFWLAI